MPKLKAALSKIPTEYPLDIDLAFDFIDHSAFDALHDRRENQEKWNVHVDIDETTNLKRGTPSLSKSRPGLAKA